MAKKEQKKMDYSAEIRLLKAEGPARAYLLYGEEDYLRDAFVSQVHLACLEGGDESFNYRRLEGDGLGLSELAQAVDAVPFMSERTLVEVRDFDINRCRDSELARLSDILSDIPEYCTVLFVMSATMTPDGRLAGTKLLKKLAHCIDFTVQDQTAVVMWVAKRLAAQSKKISRADAEYLLFCAGTLMNRLIPEIDKLASGTDGETVTRADIDRLVQRIPEADVFEMTELLGTGQFDRAAERIGELLYSKEEPIKLLALIGAQMRRMYAFKLCRSRKVDKTKTMELCGVKYDFILQKLQRSAENYTLKDLGNIIELCAEYDCKMKSTGLDNGELLKELFARMAAGATC